MILINTANSGGNVDIDVYRIPYRCCSKPSSFSVIDVYLEFRGSKRRQTPRCCRRWEKERNRLMLSEKEKRNASVSRRARAEIHNRIHTLTGKVDGKRKIGRRRRLPRFKNLQKTGCSAEKLFHTATDRIANKELAKLNITHECKIEKRSWHRRRMQKKSNDIRNFFRGTLGRAKVYGGISYDELRWPIKALA